MSMNYPALPPTGLSPAGFQVRRNAEILGKLIKAQRIALARQLSDAVVEHDAVFEQMEMFKQEAETMRRWWDYYWREAKSSLELADVLCDEYEVLEMEAEEVMSELRRLWDQNNKCENEDENEEAVERRPLGLD